MKRVNIMARYISVKDIAVGQTVKFNQDSFSPEQDFMAQHNLLITRIFKHNNEVVIYSTRYPETAVTLNPNTTAELR